MKKEQKGLLLVLACYICWGLLSIYWGLLKQVDSLYILAQRIFWSMLFMGAYLVIAGRWQETLEVLKDKKRFRLCFISGVLVTINWGVYIVAVSNGHVLDASMGYFIEPIIVALIGVIAFKERLSKFEIITFALATVGVMYMVIKAGTVPVMALLIAISFAAYGAVKKKAAVAPQVSLFVETLCMAPMAIVFILYSEAVGNGCIGVLQGSQYILIPLCGIVTSVPLLMFNMGVKDIPYYVSGILMYINPTLQFLVGLLYFKENLDTTRLYAFAFIWAGVLFTLYEKIKLMKKETGKEVVS